MLLGYDTYGFAIQRLSTPTVIVSETSLELELPPTGIRNLQARSFSDIFIPVRVRNIGDAATYDISSADTHSIFDFVIPSRWAFVVSSIVPCWGRRGHTEQEYSFNLVCFDK